ncbi:GntR family transcriptional regulator [Longilinea arvoryzae]|nr:GntR family transcriptional regulator [Longilinea arvoryzae]
MDYLSLAAKDAPMYVQIRENLRYQLLSGLYKPGDRIPTEAEMAFKWKVNRLTARRAITSLVDEGYLSRQVGRGTYVIDRKLCLNEETHLTSFWETIVALGMKPSSRVVNCEMNPAPEDFAKRLEIRVGDPIYKVQRIRLANDEPIAYQVNIFPAFIVPDLTTQDLVTLSLYALYRKNGYFPTFGDQKIRAIAADNDISSYLKVPKKSPVLYVERITRGIDRKPIEATQSYYPGDQYNIVMKLHV